jgi:hypothetical protein
MNIPDDLVLNHNTHNVSLKIRDKGQVVIIVSDEDSDELDFVGR